MNKSTEIRRTNKLNEFRYSRIEYGSRSGEDRKAINVNWFQFLKIFRTLLKYCEYPDYIVHIVIIF